LSLRGILGALLLGAAAGASAQPAPQALLQRMEQALGAASYSGVVVYARDGQLDALRIRHRGGAQRFEVIERLTGPALPLQRDAQSARLGEGPRYAADLAAVRGVAGIDPAIAYELNTVGEDRVAGRMADVFDARARDAMRFSRRYWVDRDSGLLLRVATYGSDGIVVEQWMFSDLSIDGAASGDGAVAGQAESFRSPRDADIGLARLRVLDVPKGFQLVSAAVEPQREQLVYSDGLVTVSVFAEPLAAEATVLSGHQRRGALSVFGRLYRGLQIVVVGEVPAATAERFAQGIEQPGAG
jgi:sigma-E factor negative regulatory protein RseB